jgi:hypothetical protein
MPQPCLEFGGPQQIAVTALNYFLNNLLPNSCRSGIPSWQERWDLRFSHSDNHDWVHDMETFMCDSSEKSLCQRILETISIIDQAIDRYG